MKNILEHIKQFFTKNCIFLTSLQTIVQSFRAHVSIEKYVCAIHLAANLFHFPMCTG
jgi:hypothetical protein